MCEPLDWELVPLLRNMQLDKRNTDALGSGYPVIKKNKLLIWLWSKSWTRFLFLPVCMLHFCLNDKVMMLMLHCCLFWTGTGNTKCRCWSCLDYLFTMSPRKHLPSSVKAVAKLPLYFCRIGVSPQSFSPFDITRSLISQASEIKIG